MNLVRLALFFVVFASKAVATVNDVANTLISQLQSGREMILTLSFIAGLGFMIAAFFKFKQHKDNPTQVPIGNPLTYLLIGLLLLYVGSLAEPLGQTLFEKAEAGNVTPK